VNDDDGGHDEQIHGISAARIHHGVGKYRNNHQRAEISTAEAQYYQRPLYCVLSEERGATQLRRSELSSGETGVFITQAALEAATAMPVERVIGDGRGHA
jgi:hypothetical protein